MYLNSKIISVVLAMTLLLAGCYKESDYYYSQEQIFDKLIVKVSDDGVYADGNSRITFTYKVPVEADTSLTKMLVKTTNGKFLKSDTSFLLTNFLKIDPSDTLRYAEVILISSTIPDKSVNVTATLLNYEINRTVVFDKAKPISIKLSLDPFYVKSDTSSEVNVLIRATLASEKGIASKGTTVGIGYSPEYGIIDRYITSSNIGGVAEFHFVYTGTTDVEDIVFTAWTWINDTDSILASSILQVID